MKTLSTEIAAHVYKVFLNFIKILPVLGLIALLFTMCSKDEHVVNDTMPVAGFTFTGSENPAPRKVVFTNTSSNFTSCLWDFGDGSQSMQNHPSHIYQEGGAYTVSLIAYKGNEQHTVSKTVLIYNRPDMVKMNRLTLTDFPETNQGAAWDSLSPPDVFFRITNYIGTVYYSSEVITDLAHSELPADYTRDMPFSFDGVNSVYTIRFYDYDDTLNYTYMGGYFFSMKIFVPNDGSDYPNELVFDAAGSPVKFKLAAEWTYKDEP
jgi:PKD repeat protein